MTRIASQLIEASQSLSQQVQGFTFPKPVAYVYNPLDYAFTVHRQYLERFANSTKRVIFLGMNPGPFGMAQTGVPFGEINMVQDWLGLSGEIQKPSIEHPKRMVEGFACNRSEVSGKRLWGFFKDEFQTPESFFKDHFVANYCPLLFLNEKGSNVTPDKIKREYTDQLFKLCDEYLKHLVRILEATVLVGVGNFAQKRLQKIFKDESRLSIHVILHPSPASPAANRGWSEAVKKQLQGQGIWNPIQ